MRKSGIAQAVLLLCAGCLLAIGWLPVSAQNGNLLQNPGFEAPYETIDGNPPRQVAEGWTPWHISAAPGSPSFANLQPEYEPTAPDTSRIKSGSNAQLIKSFFATHDGGVYQQVTGLTPGDMLRFSVYAYVWSNTFDEVDVSEEDGDVFVQVGIDPTGGTDAESTGIVWSPAGVEKYDAYNEYQVEGEAGGSTVTVFVRTTIGVPVKNNNIYLDDASLEVAGGSQPSQPTATSTATNTTEPPTQEVPTDVVPSSTPTATATEEPLFLTATAIIEAATATASANQTATSAAGAQQPTATMTATATQPPISNEFPATVTHTVAQGETVAILADRYDSSIDAIAEVNGLDSNYLIHVGQVLIIPVRSPVPATQTPTSTPLVVFVTATPSAPVPELGANNTYVVLPGDNLARIARLFNTTVATLAQLNGIVNVDQIQVGQTLQLPGSQPSTGETPPQSPPTSSSDTIYIVRPGDTLYRVSLLYGISIAQLAQANNITNVNRIYVGQALIIP